MKDQFIVMYVKDGLIYPIVLTESQMAMINITIPALLEHKVTLIDQPVGPAVNLKGAIDK